MGQENRQQETGIGDRKQEEEKAIGSRRREQAIRENNKRHEKSVGEGEGKRIEENGAVGRVGNRQQGKETGDEMGLEKGRRGQRSKKEGGGTRATRIMFVKKGINDIGGIGSKQTIVHNKSKGNKR